MLVFLVTPIVYITIIDFKTLGNEGLILRNGANYLPCWANSKNEDSITALTISADFNINNGKLYLSSS